MLILVLKGVTLFQFHKGAIGALISSLFRYLKPDFNSIKVRLEIDKNCYQRDKIVWLLAKDESKDVFISESQLSIQDFLTKKTAWQSTGVYFLFEYPSYEEAYKVALDMMEIHELCYSSETKDSPYWKKSVPEFMDNL